MMMDYIALAGFILSVFVAGVAVGKLVEKIERLDRRQEDEEHRNIHKRNLNEIKTK
jgi:hypothetical protein